MVGFINREIAEQADRANLAEFLVNDEKGAEIEALDVGTIFEGVLLDNLGDRPGERLGANRSVGKFFPWIDLGFDIEAHASGVLRAALRVGMVAARA
jgi:hypothetical protein